MAGTPFSLRPDKSLRARLAAQAALRRQIDAALTDAEAGAFISAEAVHAWMEDWTAGSEAPPPEPDIGG